MHLLTALVLKKPGTIFKVAVIISQGTCQQYTTDCVSQCFYNYYCTQNDSEILNTCTVHSRLHMDGSIAHWHCYQVHMHLYKARKMCSYMQDAPNQDVFSAHSDVCFFPIILQQQRMYDRNKLIEYTCTPKMIKQEKVQKSHLYSIILSQCSESSYHQCISVGCVYNVSVAVHRLWVLDNTTCVL